jgi:Tfp pilus assembly protein PilO
MSRNNFSGRNQKWPTLAQLPVPVKALVSVVILTMAFAMVGALGRNTDQNEQQEDNRHD